MANVGLTEFVGPDANWSGEAEAKETIPAGMYKLQVVDADLKTSKVGDSMVQMKFAVADGEHQGITIFQLYLLGHSNPVIRARNMKQFGKLCVAVGAPRARATDELKDKCFMAAVSEQDEGEFGWKNEVKGYEPLEGLAALQQQQAASPPATPSTGPAVTTSSPPTAPVAHEDLDF